jgi:predicted acetyltransferase
LLPTLEKVFVDFALLLNFSYFQAQLPGYIVIGVNEFYISKKYSTFRKFDGQSDISQLYCSKCQKFMQHDSLAVVTTFAMSFKETCLSNSNHSTFSSRTVTEITL